MKKILVFAMALMTGLVACKKDNDNKTPSPSTPVLPKGEDPKIENTLQVKLNGELKVANYSVKATYQEKISQMLIAAVGTKDNNTMQIGLAIGDFKGVGAYTLGTLDSRDFGNTATYYDSEVGYECIERFKETKGTLNVTEYKEGQLLKGNFQFKAKKTGTSGATAEYAEFTEGSFNIKLN
jgi:hypothetical protein